MDLLFYLAAAILMLIGQAKGSCEVSSDLPTVWLGDEQDDNWCQANQVQCSHFGLDFVCEDPNGGEFEACSNGTKVLCASPPSIPLAEPTRATTFRVIAYNVWELRYLYYQNGQRERTCRIPRELFRLHPDVDVIVFNEAFMGGCFSKFNSTVGTSVLTIRDILMQYGFVHFTGTVGDPPQLPKFENGGVFIASRWPILHADSFIYTEAVGSTSDALSGKGAVYVRVEKTVGDIARIYNILGTHLQATSRGTADDVRVAQAKEMHDLMLSQNIPSDEPIIYAGDLNAVNGTQHAFNVITALNASIPEFIGERKYTYDGVENDLLTSNGQSWIDYVVFSASHLQPMSATLEVVRPRSAEAFDVCMSAIAAVPTYPDSDRCLLNRTVHDLADHYAVMGVFEFSGPTTAAVPTDDAMTTHAGSDSLTSFGYLRLTFLSVFVFLVSQLNRGLGLIE